LQRTNLYHFGVAAICSNLYSKARWKICGAPAVLAAPWILDFTKMSSTIGFGAGSRSESPLETGAFRALTAEAELRRIARCEWWLWFSALNVTLLSLVALGLSLWRPWFRTTEHFYNLRADQAQWSTAALLALFNTWMIYRQWSFRRERRKFLPQDAESEGKGAAAGSSAEVSDPSGFDPLTGLLTRAAIERHLGKEIAFAKRQNVALSLATLHVDEIEEVGERYGKGTADQALKEFARRIKKAIRGTDYAVRLGGGDFVLVLPECTLGEVKTILNRVGPLEITVGREKTNIPYSTGWVDYQQGDLPSDLLKRANALLHLYKDAAKNTETTLAS
jgi:diguanylate cyclase (GGDEF)-like protein